MKVKSASSGTGNPRGRGTYNTACDVCSRKKTKCDGNKPTCAPCQLQGREKECTWNKHPARKPRTEQHFEALHKRSENLLVRVDEYRKYISFLENQLDQCRRDNPTYPVVDFRSSRPSETDSVPTEHYGDFLDHTFDFMNTEGSDSGSEAYLPPQILTVKEGGQIDHYGTTAPFSYEQIPPRESAPSRFPALADNPQATYILFIDGVPDDHYNPDFDWSRHLSSAVPLDRRSHDKALDLLFKFFTSWCLRIVPPLFLRDMYRALSVPASHPAPKTAHYSPMLHNALVALALGFLDDPKFRDLKARQYFANTAKSYIESECQKPNLSAVHALSILASYHSSKGDQTMGYMYFGMSARMTQALGLNVDCTEWVKLGYIDEADRLDRHWANWTTFSNDVCWSLYVGRDFCVSLPTDGGMGKDVSMPIVEKEYDEMPWVHLPSGLEPQPNHLTKTFQGTCELLLISRRIMEVVNGLNRSRTKPFMVDDLISDIDLKLNTWKQSLPDELNITIKSRATATPHKLMLHLAYWWLFILLHRPYFHRKGQPIYSTDREIDHVKLCRRAAENIMELLATWRTLYTLRYCPVTLIQTVFSAGTVFLLTAMQAGTGVRTAQKELRHSLDQQKLVMEYLDEIGRSWQSAPYIANILKSLMQEKLRPLLEKKTIAVTSNSSGSATLRVQQEHREHKEEDEPVPTRSRSSSKGKGYIRDRSLTISSRQGSRGISHSPSPSASGTRPASSAAIPMSPTITISPAGDAQQQLAASSSATEFGSAPISINSPPKSGPPFSPEQFELRNGSPSPLFPNILPSSLDFNNYPPPYTFNEPQEGPSLASSSSHVFAGEGTLSDHALSTTQSTSYPGNELSGFPGMLGGQTLPQAPFVAFSDGDTVTGLSNISPENTIPSSPNVQFCTGFLDQTPSSNLSRSESDSEDVNMDDCSDTWELWAQLAAQ